MKVIGYTRAEDEAAAKKIKREMLSWCFRERCTLDAFHWDGLAGQRGLNEALKAVEEPQSILLIWTLLDLARDLTGLVKTARTLLKNGVVIHALATKLRFAPGDTTTGVLEELARAHTRYVNENRKQGVATAKAAGATIGRPTVFTLEKARGAIERLKVESEGQPATKRRGSKRKAEGSLTDTNAGLLPSVRDLAKALGSGRTKAAELLREYREETKEKNGQQD